MKLSDLGSADAAKRQSEVDYISVFEAYAATFSDAREPVWDALEAAREDRGWDALACEPDWDALVLEAACEDLGWDALVLGAALDNAQRVADSEASEDAFQGVCHFKEWNAAILGWARDDIECDAIEHAFREPVDYLGRRRGCNERYGDDCYHALPQFLAEIDADHRRGRVAS